MRGLFDGVVSVLAGYGCFSLAARLLPQHPRWQIAALIAGMLFAMFALALAQAAGDADEAAEAARRSWRAHAPRVIGEDVRLRATAIRKAGVGHNPVGRTPPPARGESGISKPMGGSAEDVAGKLRRWA